MSRFQFELATIDDDRALRTIMAATPMPGVIAVTFRREPSFFEAARVDGRWRQIVIGRDVRDGRVVGFGSRSVREMYVNGVPRPVGYLSSLRVLEEYRGIGLLARGYAFFRELHDDGQAKFYLTTIAEGNERAIRLLTSRRAGLPAYHFAGRYHTLVLPLGAVKPWEADNGCRLDIRPARPDDRNQLVSFLQTFGSQRQFFPNYSADEFFIPQATLKDLEPAQIHLAYRKHELVGTLGGWDQSGFRQVVVERYSGLLRWTRPMLNAWASLRRHPRLPRPGSTFAHLVASVPVIRDDDPEVFRALLRSFASGTANGSHDCLLIGLHDRDPLLPVAMELQAVSYITRLYIVCCDDEGESLRRQLDKRPPYLELGSL
jgi:hypothetical protein